MADSQSVPMVVDDDETVNVATARQLPVPSAEDKAFLDPNSDEAILAKLPPERVIISDTDKTQEEVQREKEAFEAAQKAKLTPQHVFLHPNCTIPMMEWMTGQELHRADIQQQLHCYQCDLVFTKGQRPFFPCFGFESTLGKWLVDVTIPCHSAEGARTYLITVKPPKWLEALSYTSRMLERVYGIFTIPRWSPPRNWNSRYSLRNEGFSDVDICSFSQIDHSSVEIIPARLHPLPMRICVQTDGSLVNPLIPPSTLIKAVGDIGARRPYYTTLSTTGSAPPTTTRKPPRVVLPAVPTLADSETKSSMPDGCLVRLLPDEQPKSELGTSQSSSFSSSSSSYSRPGQVEVRQVAVGFSQLYGVVK